MGRESFRNGKESNRDRYILASMLSKHTTQAMPVVPGLAQRTLRGA